MNSLVITVGHAGYCVLVTDYMACAKVVRSGLNGIAEKARFYFADQGKRAAITAAVLCAVDLDAMASEESRAALNFTEREELLTASQKIDQLAGNGAPRAETPPSPVSVLGVSRPTVEEGRSFESYVDIEAESASSLKDILTSAKLYRHRKDHGRPDNDTLRQGRACHAALYEPKTFEARYITFPGRRQGKAWDDFQIKHHDKTILTAGQYEIARRVAEAVRNHPEAGAYLREPGRAELSITWTHKRTGLLIKSRFDFLCSVLLDLKTAADISKRAFGRAFRKYRYGLQFGCYDMGAVEIGAGPLPSKVVAAQKAPPWDVVVYAVPALVMDHGRQQFERALDRVVACRASNEWPGIAPHELELDPMDCIGMDDDGNTEGFDVEPWEA